MIRKIGFLSVLCFIMITTGCSNGINTTLSNKPVSVIEKENPPEEFVPKTLNVVGIGDSLTKGVGDNMDEGGYLGRVSELLKQDDTIKDINLTNYGVKGHKTTNLLKKLEEEEVASSLKEADLIFMTIGGNDIMNVVKQNILSLDFKPFREEQINYVRNFNEIVDTIRSYNPDVKIVYSGLYNPFKFLLPELTEIDNIVSEWNLSSSEILANDSNSLYVPVEDIFANATDNKLLDKEDEFHPNGIGYSLMADRIYEALTEEQDDLIEKSDE
ncbi:SGNH/GDSL hydrolase family protein [Metabacillus sp. HB246100]